VHLFEEWEETELNGWGIFVCHSSSANKGHEAIQALKNWTLAGMKDQLATNEDCVIQGALQ